MAFEKVICFAVALALISGNEPIADLDCMNATVGENVLLPVSYIIPHGTQFWPSLQWRFGEDNIVYYFLTNGTLNAEGQPTWTYGEITIFPNFQGRVEFFNLNGSLLLKNVQLNDSGTYCFMLIDFEHNRPLEKKIIVRVWNTTSVYGTPEDIKEDKNFIVFVVRTVLCCVPIITLGILIHSWRCK